jgi:hypothetical protein
MFPRSHFVSAVALAALTSCGATPPGPSDAQAPPALGMIGVELQAEDPMPGGQFVWIMNGSERAVDLGCSTLRSKSTGNVVTIESGFRVPAGAVGTLTPEGSWLSAVDQIELVDSSGRAIDQTPELRDAEHDDRIWYRASPTETWQFGRSGAPRGRPVVRGHISRTTPAGC